jgi:hypothetical protein
MDKFNARNVAAAGGRVTHLSACVGLPLWWGERPREPALAQRNELKSAREDARPTEVEGTHLPAVQKWLANKSCRARVQNIVNREIFAPQHTRGVLAKYAAHVTSASFGAVTDMDLKL